MFQQIINNQNPTDAFLKAFHLARVRLQKQFIENNQLLLVRENMKFIWLKPEYSYPSFDHITFGYMNSVFSVALDINIDGVSLMSNEFKDRLINECSEYNHIPCRFKIDMNLIEDNSDITLSESSVLSRCN